MAILQSLRDALDLLASDAFAPAYGGSTKQKDYRWGKLHRITFDHPLGAPFSVPPAQGFQDLSPILTGVSRDGGYEVVNASSFSARANSVNGFKFGGGPVRRYVGVAGPGVPPPFGVNVLGMNVMPGGSSGNAFDPLYTIQLPAWLTADYHSVPMDDGFASIGAISTESFVPVP